MNRRIASILLLPCVLLTQSVAVLGHSHEGGQPAGHESRPHFHVSSSSAARDRGHQHHGSHGHHHHHHDGHDTDPAPPTEPAPRPEPLSKHDSDAVYVDWSIAVNERPAVQKDLASAWEVPAEAYLPGTLGTNSLQTAAHWIHKPPLRGCACALYISQRALLI